MSIAGVPRACHRVGRSSQARARRRGQLYTVSNPPPTHLSIGVKLSKLTEPLLCGGGRVRIRQKCVI